MKNPWLKNEHEEKIEFVLQHFNFERIQSVMKAINWTWFDSHVPSIPEMKEMATELMRHVIECPDWIFCSSGGFVARFHNEDLSLSFEIEEICSSDSEYYQNQE